MKSGIMHVNMTLGKSLTDSIFKTIYMTEIILYFQNSNSKSYCCPGTDICFNVDDWYHRLQRLTDATAPPSGTGVAGVAGGGSSGGTFGPTNPPTTISGGTGGSSGNSNGNNSNGLNPNPCEPGCECAPDYHRNILTG